MSELIILGSGAATEAIRWHQWGRAAFAQAEAEQKPVLLAITAAWCEECARMDRSSYARADVVARVNEQFVAIRVDADRRPDLNERYNLGGWPTTVFLTPAGDVLAGSTYIDGDRLLTLLQEVAAAWRTRRAEILAQSARTRALARADEHAAPEPDLAAPDRLRDLLTAMFDRQHGGLGDAPKSPHATALRLGLGLFADAPDAGLQEILIVTLDRSVELWDPVEGGFFRYAEAADWTRPGTEKLLAEQAALLHLFVDAALTFQTDTYRQHALSLARWVKGTLGDQPDGGFFNAQAADAEYYSLEAAVRATRRPPAIDRSMYVDSNAEMAAAFFRAAELLGDAELREFAVASLERIVLAGYTPGAGVAHVVEPHGAAIRGLLGDQVRAASALIWAHGATEQLPYSMLAAELMQFALRTMWDGEAFLDRASDDAEAPPFIERSRPFALNCEAACTLARLSTLTGNRDFHDRAMDVLRSQAPLYPRFGLFGAPYALAIREVMHGRVPPGLNLSHVDWRLDERED